MSEGPTQALNRDDGEVALVQRFRLRVLAGPDAGSSYTAKRAGVTIGTHPSTDFVLRDTTLSRFHCEITLQGGKPLLRDLGSRNGTLVDGVPIHVAPLRDGATLTLGRTEVRFELDDEPVKVKLSKAHRFGRLVGQSHSMRAVFALLERAASTDTTVLLQGETGTGKDRAAEAIHAESARKDGPFVVVDCASIPAPLLEAELFGYEKGAFTGADHTHDGAFQAASSGTLFLDEIGELPLEVQPKLLRAIETLKVQRMGSTNRQPVDVRIVAATHHNLRSEVNEKRFRSDLYYRLAVLEIAIPPLRERLEDLPLLVEALIEVLQVEDSPGLELVRSKPFLADLGHHSWPGNIRELRNYVERSLALEERAPPTGAPLGADPLAIDISRPLRDVREDWLRHLQRRYLEKLLQAHGQNVSEAARAAGMARVHFYRLMAQCNLRREPKSGE